MLKSFSVDRLNGRINCDFEFLPDLNIITGRNGSGKTTVLKLIWYIVSGNFWRIPREMKFRRADLVSERARVTLEFEKEDDVEVFSYQVISDGKLASSGRSPVGAPLHRFQFDKHNRPVRFATTSLFFPTFRRIEGGFSYDDESFGGGRGRLAHVLQRALQELSEEFTSRDHTFVSSISTDDIISLVTQRYAEISESANTLHAKLSETIAKSIQDYRISRDVAQTSPSLAPQIDTVLRVLQKIEDEVESVEKARGGMLRPITVLSQLVGEVFQHRGIRLTRKIAIGDPKDAVASDALSSGEKQMLSFLCYNAFHGQATFIIDEPELSLHPDWQRILFPTLLEQQKNNQFIVATHSPFIYAKFPERELRIVSDRGDRSAP